LGTALVPFDDQDHWEAWHQLQHKKADERQSKLYRRYEILAVKLKKWGVIVALLGASISLSGFVLLELEYTGILTAMSTVVLGVPLAVSGAMTFFRPVYTIWMFDFGLDTTNDKTLTEILTTEHPLNFSCPSCHERVNLAAPWICGHCRNEHENWINGSLFLGCVNSDCYVAGKLVEPSRKHRAATAYQCPSCADHILINPKLYQQANSHTKPYRGVARFIGDTQQPKVNGKLSANEITIGDLINQAIDQSI
jgi:predicted RNA-binding Zn-ribbon protein involved in translation (DUF1610 family)